MNANDFWADALEVSERETHSGGGGIVGKAEISFGYKVYVSGATQAETFFPAPAEKAKTEERAKALAAAKAYLASHGKSDRPSWSIQIRVFRDTAVVGGEPATWKDDRYFVSNMFSDAAKEVVKSLREAGIPRLPWTGWVRIGFIDDPFRVSQGEAGKTDKDQEGNPRYPQVAVVREVFPNEEAARAAVMATSSDVPEEESEECPPGYDASGWALVRAEIKKLREGGTPVKKIADDYAIPVNWVVKA